jgi:hypothetical protein
MRRDRCGAFFPSDKAGFRDFEGDHRDDLWVTAARSTMSSLRLWLSPTPERTDRDRVDAALWRALLRHGGAGVRYPLLEATQKTSAVSKYFAF